MNLFRTLQTVSMPTFLLSDISTISKVMSVYTPKWSVSHTRTIQEIWVYINKYTANLISVQTRPLTRYNSNLFISVINQMDAQNFCFTISLFHASTCFEHICSSSGGQNCITHHHTYRCDDLVNYWDEYTAMHGQQNVKIQT